MEMGCLPNDITADGAKRETKVGQNGITIKTEPMIRKPEMKTVELTRSLD